MCQSQKSRLASSSALRGQISSPEEWGSWEGGVSLSLSLSIPTPPIKSLARPIFFQTTSLHEASSVLRSDGSAGINDDGPPASWPLGDFSCSLGKYPPGAFASNFLSSGSSSNVCCSLISFSLKSQNPLSSSCVGPLKVFSQVNCHLSQCNPLPSGPIQVIPFPV